MLFEWESNDQAWKFWYKKTRERVKVSIDRYQLHLSLEPNIAVIILQDQY